MFDISWGELVLVGVVALLVIGPKELPTVLRTVGQWMTKMRRMAAEFQSQFNEAMREAEFADLKQQVESIVDPKTALSDLNPLDSIQKELDSAQKDVETALADTPAPTPSGEPHAVIEGNASVSAGEPEGAAGTPEAVPSRADAEPDARDPAAAEPAGAEAASVPAGIAEPADPVEANGDPANPSAAGGRAA